MKNKWLQPARSALAVLATVALLPLVAASANAATPTDTASPQMVVYARNPHGCDLLVSTDIHPKAYSLGGCMLGGPHGAQGAGSDVYIFVRGTNSGVFYVKSADSYGNGPYSGWVNLGGRITDDPTPWTDSVGRVGVKGTGTDGHTWCRWNYSRNSDSWVSWRKC